MPPSSFVFDEPHGGQPVDFKGELPRVDLDELRSGLKAHELRDEQVVRIRDLCRRVREASDRAVFFNDGSIQAPISIHAWGGMGVFPVLCLTDPDYVTELHEIVTEHSLGNLRKLLPEIGAYVDILMMAADDWGTQQNTIASPKVYRDLFLPYRQRLNHEAHRLAPGAKTFLHSCGAIYKLLDLIVESGFDIANPVQWPAGGHSYAEWKDKARGRITLWGGGLNAQATLPLGSLEEVESEVKQVVSVLAQDGGYVFCNIHNLLAEIPPEKIVAIYRAAGSISISIPSNT
jgi:uroporphyrinogen decarboxylase